MCLWVIPFSFYETFSLFYKSNLVGNGTLSYGLFSINLQNDTTNNTMHAHIGTKRCVMNEDSSMLWHRRLRHISIHRIKRLVNDRVLSTLILPILTLVWTALRENKPISLKRCQEKRKHIRNHTFRYLLSKHGRVWSEILYLLHR